MNATTPTLRLDTHQNQTLTPRLQHAVRMLRLSSLEYLQELRGMSDSNPFLELEDSEPTSESLGESTLAITAASATVGTADESSGSDAEAAADASAALDTGWESPPELSTWQSTGASDRGRSLSAMVDSTNRNSGRPISAERFRSLIARG